MAYATPADVAVRWGRELTPEETASVAVRLEDVERLIRRNIPNLDAQVDSGAIDVDDVVQVESDSVLRMSRNPEGFISETDGDYTYKLSDAAAANFAGGVGDAGVITEGEWLLLGVSSPRAGKGMFFLTPRAVVGGAEYPTDWESETPESAGPQKWKRRRDQEDMRNYYRVLDWVRHRI